MSTSAIREHYPGSSSIQDCATAEVGLILQRLAQEPHTTKASVLQNNSNYEKSGASTHSDSSQLLERLAYFEV